MINSHPDHYHHHSRIMLLCHHDDADHFNDTGVIIVMLIKNDYGDYFCGHHGDDEGDHINCQDNPDDLIMKEWQKRDGLMINLTMMVVMMNLILTVMPMMMMLIKIIVRTTLIITKEWQKRAAS